MLNKIKTKVLGQRLDLGHGGERQIATRLIGIRNDHLTRYYHAGKNFSGCKTILDVASGIGYGSKILAELNHKARVFAVDKDINCHFFGNNYYHHKNLIRFPLLIEDIKKIESDFDGITSFETIEHLNDPNYFLKDLAHLSNRSTKFFVSCPNEKKLPFSKEKFKFHVQHFTPSQLEKLLDNNGWAVIRKNSINNKFSKIISNNCEGNYLLYECKIK